MLTNILAFRHCYGCGARSRIAEPHCRGCGAPLVLDMRYELRCVIGRGGFGTVYEAQDRRLGQRRAVKSVYNGELSQRDAIEAEWQHLRDHAAELPFIPDVYDVVRANDTTYLVMEYIPGDTLAAAVARNGPWPAAQVEACVHTLLGYLALMHGRGLLHRDLKPHNIKYLPMSASPGRQYVLLDFGIARRSDQQTQHYGRAVSLPYSPPEQRNGQPTDCRSDLFSLAATAYYLLTGDVPADIVAFLSEIPHEIIGELVEVGASPALGHTLLHMLQLSPDDRPRDAAAALALLNIAWSPLPTMLSYNRETESVQQAVEETLPATDVYVLSHGKVGQPSWLSSVTFAPNGQTLAAAQGAVRLWSVSDKSLLCSIGDPEGLANSVAYSPDGQLLAIASPEEITLWNTAGWARVWAVTRGAGQNNGIVFSADGQELIVAGAMGVERCRVEDGESIAQHRFAHDDLYSIALAPDGAAFVTVVGGTARRWCVTDGTEFGSPIELSEDINAVALGPGGAVLALLTDTAVLVWGTDGTPPLRLEQGGQQGAFSSNGHLLAIGSSGSVWLWNLELGSSPAEAGSHKLLQCFQSQTDVVGALAFSLDGQLLATTSWEGTVSIYGPLCLVAPKS